jgi:DNA primase
MFYTEEQVEAVLASIGLDIEAEVGDDWLVFCPYHDNHRTPAGEVNKERGTFYCFSCRAAATLEKLVMRVSGRTYFEAVRLIKSKETSSDIVNIVSKSLIDKPDFVAFDQALVDRLYDNTHKVLGAQQYFASRNISRESIDKFKLGYSINNEMVTVPVHSPDGLLIGFVARSVEGKAFKNSPGLSKSKTLFNLHRVKSAPYVFVVESSFDVIRLDQEGIPAVATLGAGVSARQLKLLNQYFNVVYSVPDQDTAGREMDNKLGQALGRKLSSILLPSGAKDVGDLTNDQIKKLKYHVADPLLGVL